MYKDVQRPHLRQLPAKAGGDGSRSSLRCFTLSRTAWAHASAPRRAMKPCPAAVRTEEEMLAQRLHLLQCTRGTAPAGSVSASRGGTPLRRRQARAAGHSERADQPWTMTIYRWREPGPASQSLSQLAREQLAWLLLPDMAENRRGDQGLLRHRASRLRTNCCRMQGSSAITIAIYTLLSHRRMARRLLSLPPGWSQGFVVELLARGSKGLGGRQHGLLTCWR